MLKQYRVLLRFPNQAMIKNADSDLAADLDNTEIGYELVHESDETENGVVRVDEIVSSRCIGYTMQHIAPLCCMQLFCSATKSLCAGILIQLCCCDLLIVINVIKIID